jgi:hypothetical protein
MSDAPADESFAVRLQRGGLIVGALGLLIAFFKH